MLEDSNSMQQSAVQARHLFPTSDSQKSSWMTGAQNGSRLTAIDDSRRCSKQSWGRSHLFHVCADEPYYRAVAEFSHRRAEALQTLRRGTDDRGMWLSRGFHALQTSAEGLAHGSGIA
jgi:hypothetical protein